MLSPLSPSSSSLSTALFFITVGFICSVDLVFDFWLKFSPRSLGFQFLGFRREILDSLLTFRCDIIPLRAIPLPQAYIGQKKADFLWHVTIEADLDRNTKKRFRYFIGETEKKICPIVVSW
jgi:hypothetical protein